jgi:hypothetical protein
MFSMTEVSSFLSVWAMTASVVTTVKITIIFGGNNAGVLSWFSTAVTQTTVIASIWMLEMMD